MNQPIDRPGNRDWFELHIVLTAPPQNPGEEWHRQHITETLDSLDQHALEHARRATDGSA